MRQPCVVWHAILVGIGVCFLAAHPHALAADTASEPTTGTAASKTPPTMMPAFPPKTITATFRNISLAKMLRLVARQSGKSIAIHGDVTQNTSISFDNISVEDAFQSLLDIGHLSAQYVGDVVVIEPDANSMVTRSFTVKDINVAELTDSLRQLYTQQVTLQAVPNNNVLLVTSRPNLADEIAEVVARLDRAPRQVLIDAAIVEVSLDDSTQLGVNLGALIEQSQGAASLLTTGFAGNPAVLPNPVGLFADGNVIIESSDNNVDMLLEALQTITDTKVLSHPRVIGLNDQEAEIIVGQKLGFRVTTTTQTSTQETVQFLEVGTQLKVTPHITENNTIIMDIHPEVSDGSISEDGLPNESTSEITTRVNVEDGQTIILGGLFRERKQDIVQQVPLLGDIPLLGALFRRTEEEIIRSELLVFMRPRILKPGEPYVVATEDRQEMRQEFKEQFRKIVEQSKTDREQGTVDDVGYNEDDGY